MKYLTVIRTTAVIKKMAGGGGIRGRGREGKSVFPLLMITVEIKPKILIDYSKRERPNLMY